MQMVAHGFSTAALFMMAGALQQRLHTREMGKMGGLWAKAPRMGALTMFFVVASLGMPGLGNFVGEILVLIGTFQVRPWLAFAAALGHGRRRGLRVVSDAAVVSGSTERGTSARWRTSARVSSRFRYRSRSASSGSVSSRRPCSISSADTAARLTGIAWSTAMIARRLDRDAATDRAVRRRRPLLLLVVSFWRHHALAAWLTVVVVRGDARRRSLRCCPCCRVRSRRCSGSIVTARFSTRCSRRRVS